MLRKLLFGLLTALLALSLVGCAANNDAPAAKNDNRGAIC